jgi:hypothetical protein
MKDKLNYVDWILLRFPLSGNTGIWNAPFISWGTYLTLIEWSYILQHYRWHSTASLKHPASCSPHSTFILQQADEDRYQLFRKTCLLPLRTVTLLQTYSCDLNWMAVEKESYFAITVKRLWQFLRDFWMKDLGYSDIYNTVHRIRMCSEKKKTIRMTELVLFRNRKLVNWKQSTGLGYLFLGDDKEGPNCVWFTKFLLQGVSTFHYKTSRTIPLVLWGSSRTQQQTIWPNEFVFFLRRISEILLRIVDQ